MPKRHHHKGHHSAHHSMGGSDAAQHDRSFAESEPRGKRSYGMYEGESHRRHQEMADAGMIHEDHSAIANLPQGMMIKPYPMTGGYMGEEDLDDTIRGIDRQKGMDSAKEHSELRPKKY